MNNIAVDNNSKVIGLSPALTTMTGSDNTLGATKGDLVVMGDFNGDGKFDGHDLYMMARGAAVAEVLEAERP